MNFEKFDVIWVEMCNYAVGASIQAHKHDFFHFILVMQGEGRIGLRWMEYPMRAGMLFPIPAGVEHAFYTVGDAPLRTAEIKFRLTDEMERRRIEALPIPMAVEGDPMKEALLSIYHESHTADEDSEKIIALNFALFMRYLCRFGKRLSEAVAPAQKRRMLSPEIERVAAYIEENLSEALTLSDLASVARFEKNYFLRKFRRQLGCTPMEYLLTKRMEKAKQMLRFSDMNVTQIAAATGFKSVHYFSKVFYDYVKERPSEYRAK